MTDDEMFVVTIKPDGALSLDKESFREWSARGRPADCDCGLLQCECTEIRRHKPGCERRLSITSPIDLGLSDCTCGTTP